MPKQSYAFVRGEEKCLQISWSVGWKNFQIHLDDQLIGKIATKKEMESGKSFLLTDNSTLDVKLHTSAFSNGIEVYRNGQIVPGSYGDPIQNIDNISYMIYFFSAMNIILGSFAIILQIDFLLELGMGIVSIGLGFLLALLGFFVSRKSGIALTLFIIFYVINVMLTLVSGTTSGIFISIIIIYFASTGYKSIKEIKQGPKTI